jgi:hypothetical protein
MLVEPDGGEPLLVEDLSDRPRLPLGVHVHVAVVVVADVGVVEPGEGSGFLGGAQVGVVPVGDHRLAVRVE